LARAGGHAAVLVANDDEDRKGEFAATLHDLGHAVEADDALGQIGAVALVVGVTNRHASKLPMHPFTRDAGLVPLLCGWRHLALEPQSGFAGGVGQRFDPTVIQKAAAVEYGARNARLLG